jgi:hypothetical protein
VIGSQDGGVLGDLADAGISMAGHAITGNKPGVARAIGSGLAAVGRVAGRDSSMATRNAFGGYLYAAVAVTANALSGRIIAKALSDPGDHRQEKRERDGPSAHAMPRLCRNIPIAPGSKRGMASSSRLLKKLATGAR